MMNHKILLTIALLLISAGSLIYFRGSSRVSGSHSSAADSRSPSQATMDQVASDVPAFQTGVELESLPPTLPETDFVGKAREAYAVAKKIPETLAQIPCYCHCDRGFGHKSLHTCFVDDHASHCAVCVDEALLAYRLQRDENLTAAEVRRVIIKKYSGGH